MHVLLFLLLLILLFYNNHWYNNPTPSQGIGITKVPNKIVFWRSNITVSSKSKNLAFLRGQEQQS